MKTHIRSLFEALDERGLLVVGEANGGIELIDCECNSVAPPDDLAPILEFYNDDVLESMMEWINEVSP